MKWVLGGRRTLCRRVCSACGTVRGVNGSELIRRGMNVLPPGAYLQTDDVATVDFREIPQDRAEDCNAFWIGPSRVLPKLPSRRGAAAKSLAKPACTIITTPVKA